MIRNRLFLAVLPLAALTGTPAFAAPAKAPAIVRHAATPPRLILQGVTVSPGTEMLYLSGQLASPVEWAVGKPPASLTPADFGDTKTQTISIFTKIKGILAAKGYALSDIIKLTVFVAADPKMNGKMDFTGFNDGFKQFFGTPENPNTVARSTVQVAALAGPNFLIEIEAIAAKAK